MRVYMSKENLEQFLAWMSSDSMVTTLPGDGGRTQDVFAFLRTPLSASVEAVFGGRFSGESKWQFPLVEKLDLVGYYQKEKDIFYNADTCMGSLAEEIKAETQARILACLDENSDAIKAGTSEKARFWVDGVDDYARDREVLKMFFEGEEFPVPCFVAPEKGDLIDSLEDREAVVQKLTAKTLEEKMDEYACYLLCKERRDKAYAKFIKNTPKKALITRKIMAAAKAEEEKGAMNLCVEIQNKEGKTMSFSFPADHLSRAPGSALGSFFYSAYAVPKKVRDSIKKFFQGEEDRPWLAKDGFYPEEILRITYKKKEVYVKR